MQAKSFRVHFIRKRELMGLGDRKLPSSYCRTEENRFEGVRALSQVGTIRVEELKYLHFFLPKRKQ